MELFIATLIAYIFFVLGSWSQKQHSNQLVDRHDDTDKLVNTLLTMVEDEHKWPHEILMNIQDNLHKHREKMEGGVIVDVKPAELTLTTYSADVQATENKIIKGQNKLKHLLKSEGIEGFLMPETIARATKILVEMGKPDKDTDGKMQ